MELFRAEVVLVGRLSRDVGAQRGMGHLGADVDRAGHRFEGVEVLAEALPPPVDALVQGGARDVLDGLHQLDQEVVLVGPRGCEADTAVAHHDRGRAVPGGGRHLRIPGHLTVVVGMDVDPARGHDRPVGIDLSVRRARLAAHLGDHAVVDGEVAGEAVGAGAVDDRAVADDEVMGHGVSFRNGASRLQRGRIPGQEREPRCAAAPGLVGPRPPPASSRGRPRRGLASL